MIFAHRNVYLKSRIHSNLCTENDHETMFSLSGDKIILCINRLLLIRVTYMSKERIDTIKIKIYISLILSIYGRKFTYTS